MTGPRARSRADAGALRAALLGWYRRARRDLPWRATDDPYAIWVSEVMLQQTRVETVVPYYTRFLLRFPDARALADAPEDEVLSQWSGLGYYRRARLLQAGARELVARHDGVMPRDPAARRALPGIGRYTAGAIGSIAFGLEEALVDGNVARVLARLDALDGEPATREHEGAVWDRAQELVRGETPGELNQALMELGATVCTPRAPRCGDCPVAGACVARAEGRQDTLPRAKPRPAPRVVHEVALCAGDGRRVLLVRRDGPGLFGGLWQLPRADGHGARAAREAAESASLGGRARPTRAAEVERVLTHRRIVVEVWVAAAPRRVPEGARLLGEAARTAVGLSSFTRAVLASAGYVTGAPGASREKPRVGAVSARTAPRPARQGRRS